jgi:DNA polymerase I-like protein with 3'-5' exonuclease and polymerase domains
VLQAASVAELQALVGSSKRWAIDVESNGADLHSPDFLCTGIGLANEATCFYIHLETLPADTAEWLKHWLTTVELTAFNVFYDGTALQRYTGKWLNWFGCSYVLFRQLATEGFTGQRWSLEFAQLNVLGWPVSNKAALEVALAERGLKKSQLSQLPIEIVGPYAASDADAHWQLWHVLWQTCADKGFEYLQTFHSRESLTHIRLTAEQQLRGMHVDYKQLTSYRADLLRRIDAAMSAFLTHSEVAHHIKEYERGVHAMWAASAPPQFNKDGVTVAKRWEAWKAKEELLPRFNPNSKLQLIDLFYNKMGFTARKFTETGRPVVDRKVLPHLGVPGKLLAEYNLLVKERGYVEAWLEKSKGDVLHPQVNVAGTATLRPSGTGGVNVLQSPKSRGFLECIKARPGHKLIQLDCEALEPTILAEFSQDATLLKLYGPNARPSDVYLFLAAQIPELGREICKYFDPENPTPESISAAKKHCKRDRAIAKTVHLAAGYGAGAPKMHETLTLGGIDITLAQVKKIHTNYWRLFRGVKQFGERLTSFWESSGGWFPTSRGTPAGLAHQYIKDITNRFCQTSASLILQTFIWHIDRLRKERGIPMEPWIVNYYDEVILEAPDAFAEAAAKILVDALAATNAELGMGIQIKGKPQIATSLADIKCE